MPAAHSTRSFTVASVSSSTVNRAGSAPFVYDMRGKPVAMSYWSLPEEAMDSPQSMKPWAQLAIEAARRKPQAKPRKRRG